MGSSLADSISSGGRTLSPRPISNFTSIAPIDASGPQVDVKALLDFVSGPIMVDGDFMTPEQMDANHRAAAAESDAAMRTYLDKSVAQNGQRLANGVDQLLKGIKPLPTLMESPVTGRFGNLMDLSREDRQIADARANALATASLPRAEPWDGVVRDAPAVGYLRSSGAFNANAGTIEASVGPTIQPFVLNALGPLGQAALYAQGGYQGGQGYAQYQGGDTTTGVLNMFGGALTVIGSGVGGSYV